MTTRYQQHPELRLTAIEGEGVVLHLGSRRYFSVSESGLAVLEALAAPRTAEELVGLLLERYEVTAEHARSCARAFLDRCVSAELLVIAPES